ncbi:hypothetical protein AGMMS49950_06140 [Endomicrobiia bacterium]|nr:hypothetical protein AGMMS49950_06140 [Endomicrobiia bacterium]
MSTENIVKMMFEYFRAIPEHIVTRDNYNISKSCAYRTIEYSDILSQERVTMSAKVVDIDIGYAQEALMSSGEYTRWE